MPIGVVQLSNKPPAPSLPTWKSRDYTRAARLAPSISRDDLGPDKIAIPTKFGVEIEMDRTSLLDTRRTVAHVLGAGCTGRSKGVTDAAGRLWQVKPDEGTLVEVASPVLDSLEDLRKMQGIAAAMGTQGAVSHERCGTHFHVDARAMDVPHMIRLIALLARHELHLYKALGVHGGRAHYCMPMQRNNVVALLDKPPTSPFSLCKLYRGPTIERDRGLNVENLLNFGSKVTLEFRYFNGTLNPHVLGCYAGLVMGLTHYALASRDVPQRRDVLGQPNLPMLLQQIGMSPTHPVATLLMGRLLASK